MTREQFIIGIRKVVYESAIRGTLSNIQKPPGKKPPESLVAVSEWFAELSDADKTNLESVIALAARQAVFGMLAVLDGVRQIEDEETKGSLELWFSKGNKEVLLNAADGEYLHDLFSQQMPPL